MRKTVEKNADDMLGEYCWIMYKIDVQFSVDPMLYKDKNELGSEYIPKSWSSIWSCGITPSKYNDKIMEAKKVKKK